MFHQNCNTFDSMSTMGTSEKNNFSLPVYSACMSSVSVLFSDSFATMVKELGLLESDFEMSQSQEDGHSQASVSTVATGRRPKNGLRKDLHSHELSSDDEEAEDGGS